MASLSHRMFVKSFQGELSWQRKKLKRWDAAFVLLAVGHWFIFKTAGLLELSQIENTDLAGDLAAKGCNMLLSGCIILIN